MKLVEFYDHVGPYLLGQRPHDETVRRLYGGDPRHARDGERLAIYGRFCRIHRQEVFDRTFAYCHDVVVAGQGRPAWEALIEDYFVRHPMHHFEINHNGRYFSEYLSERAAAGTLPPFLGELADFEWWEWRTDTQLDEPADLAAGPPRLHSTVELRPYGYDLLTWIGEDERQPEGPAQRPIVVLFWRDRDLDPRRELTSPVELQIIKAVYEGIPLDAALAGRMGIAAAELDETVADLRAAGILIGG